MFIPESRVKERKRIPLKKKRKKKPFLVFSILKILGFTLDSGINIGVRLLIFGIFSSGYVLIKESNPKKVQKSIILCSNVLFTLNGNTTVSVWNDLTWMSYWSMFLFKFMNKSLPLHKRSWEFTVLKYILWRRCWVAAHMCVKSHFRTCDVRAEVRAERVCELCVRCRCVRAYFWIAMCDRTFNPGW